ncbi:MAG TPA: carbohydrate ABC transporter permease [Candidatus Hydrogenedentes bacterium]|nr:carbohydrate ABC transporter permease [Candidatus Hydrogenedentota bacterium]HQH54399.1 carbohydrate ABC transporter permease [Candidatus Hydrogenedentota bacterium]HQM47891.1 carbohydrate ABC transporter permease [Candidatus Hydrogenedentota bacterium]
MANEQLQRRWRQLVGVLWRAGLMLILLTTFFPFLFMLMTSFKDTHQFYHSFWLPAWPVRFENYAGALTDMHAYIANSIFVTAVSISGILLFGSISGFVFARYRFPGREVIYYGMISMMMIPGVLLLVPSFLWVKQLGLLDSYVVMILPYIAGGQILGIYLLRGFFSQIDNDLFEAAQVDGAGLLRQLWHVGLPLAKPVLGVVAIVSALGVWNQFLWPLVTTSSEEVMVLTVGMLRYNSRVAGQYGRMFAGYTVSAIPLGILFLFATRVFMKGITAGALKA